MNKKIFLGVVTTSIGFLAACGPTPPKKAEEPKEVVKEAQVPVQKKADDTMMEQTVPLASGETVTLKYQIMKPGTSEVSPQIGKKVTVHYAGWLEENGGLGRKFDSSVDRGKKFTFTIGIGQVIAGWDKGVMGMKVGEKRRLFIPYQLAYGERGIPGVIPSKSTLIFDVELFDVG